MIESTSQIYCQLFQRLFGPEECPGSIGFYALSSFFVSIETIRSRPVEFYRHALAILQNTPPHWKNSFEWKQSENLFIRPDRNTIWNRQFASGKVLSIYMERMWHLIFAPAAAFADRHPVFGAITPAPETKDFYSTRPFKQAPLYQFFGASLPNRSRKTPL